MSFRQFILNLTPHWVVILATDIRCILRCWVICGRISYQEAGNNSALIVVPHPDDETFGCGGLIKLKCSAGVPVRIILLTDGEAIGSGLSERPEVVVMARRSGFMEACQRLGLEVDSLRWLHLPDGKLPHPEEAGFSEAVKALAMEIEEFDPREIYCPHAMDVRSDHIAATLITREAQRLRDRACEIFYYPVWMWYHASSGLAQRLDLRGAWRLDISAVLSAKKQAMAAYLEAPKTNQGNPFCGKLPWSFLWNFRRSYEVFFPAAAADGLAGPPQGFESPST